MPFEKYLGKNECEREKDLKKKTAGYLENIFHSSFPLSASFSTFVDWFDWFDNSDHTVSELWKPSTGPAGESGGAKLLSLPTHPLSSVAPPIPLQLRSANEGLLPLRRGRDAIKMKTKAGRTRGREGRMSHA